MDKRRRKPVIVQDDDTSDFDFFRCRSSDSSPEKPVQRNKANARERARMRVLSKAFRRLKTSLPWVPPDTKLSKLDTLRQASTYIAHLRKILREDNDNSSTQIIPSNTRNCTRDCTHPVTLFLELVYRSTGRTKSKHGRLIRKDVDCRTTSSLDESQLAGYITRGEKAASGRLSADLKEMSYMRIPIRKRKTWPFTINSRSAYGHSSPVPTVPENNRIEDNFSHDVTTNYRNYVPCEYITVNQPDYHRIETMEQYVSQ